jgi:hypothetical protein
MDDQFAQRVRSAAAAGWWTVLIGVIWLTVVWFVYLAIMAHRPEWMLCLWGGQDMTWATIRNISLWFFGVFKLVLYIFVLLSIWLTIWGRKLRQAGK